MKTFSALCFLILLIGNCKAQIVPFSEPCRPDFPGGNAALINFIQKHTHYPDSAIAHEISGKVVVGFKVDTSGRIDSLHIVISINPYLDKEALRVFQLLPSFIPCKTNGIAVPYYYVLPILFYLN